MSEAPRQRWWELGYFAHLPATSAVLRSGFLCLAAFDVFVGMAHSFLPRLFSEWVLWSQPVTTFMAGFIPAIEGVSRNMLFQGLGARAPLMENLIAWNWAILGPVYLITIPAILIDLRDR